jgi:hypothetical protein
MDQPLHQFLVGVDFDAVGEDAQVATRHFIAAPDGGSLPCTLSGRFEGLLLIPIGQPAPGETGSRYWMCAPMRRVLEQAKQQATVTLSTIHFFCTVNGFGYDFVIPHTRRDLRIALKARAAATIQALRQFPLHWASNGLRHTMRE